MQVAVRTSTVVSEVVFIVRVFLCGLVALLGLALLPASAAAQNAGVSISPGLIEETLNPGVSRTYDLDITNQSASEQEYFLFTRNIRSVGGGGEPVFADDGERTGYELADWVTLPVSSVVVDGGEKVTVTFDLDVPNNATPGSHFGGVFISAKPPDIESSGAAVGYQVANIISIRVSGDVIEEAGIRQFSTGQFIYGAQDVDFNVRIENTGNVLVRPSGPLEVFNSLGKKVGSMTFNDSDAGVFPADTREFDMQWIGDGLGFGRYEAILSPVYGESGARKTMSSTVVFWILPFNIMGPALGALIVTLLVVVVGVRLYVKRALATATAGRRRVRRKSQSGPSAMLLTMVSVLVVVSLFLLVLLALFA